MEVLFIDTVHEVLKLRLEQSGFRCVDGTQLHLEELKQALKSAEGIVVRSKFPMNANLLDEAPHLQFIARSGAGMENIDVPYCQRRGIQLFNAPEGNRNAVGEHALGMLLSLLNRIHLADREVRNGKWDREGNRGYELDGKTVGIIGYGNNGSAFAKKLRGFDVSVIAYDKYKTGFGDTFVSEVSMEEIFAKSDIVSFHIPQNDETRFMGDRHFFDRFQKPIYVINLARGKIIRTHDLVMAIQSGHILGACLDVLEYEKSSFESFFDQKLDTDFQFLLESDKVVLTPHVGGWTHESYFKLSNVLADKILSAFNT
jgi:D-3-phosphoglycerate dehydrogenase